MVDTLGNVNNKQPAQLAKSLWRHFNPSINQSLLQANKWLNHSSHSEFVLGIIKIQNMAAIILTYGEEVTIRALEGLLKIIKNCFKNDVKVIRNGLDTIVFICPHESQEIYLSNIENLFSELGEYSSSLPGTPICFSLKIGASLMNKGADFRVILDQAFIALYECEFTEASKHYFFEEVSLRMAEYQKQLKDAANFQSVIFQKRIKLAYQPVIDAKTGKIKSYEALLRIIDENGQITSAGPLIPIAEKYGFIEKVDLFVLESAVNELKMDDEVNISINVSNISVHNQKWFACAKSLLDDVKIASRLIIELTETGVQRNLKRISEFVDAVQAIGCKVAIDDFGAGYTSFSQLKILEIDYIKIDGAFIKDIEENPDSKLFVKTLQEFASAFGVKTIAEFVETGNVAKTLMDLGVDYLQGYYFGKPVNYRPWIKGSKLV